MKVGELVCTVSPEVAVEFGIVAGAKAIAKVDGKLQPFRWIVSPYLKPGQIGAMVRVMSDAELART